MEEEREWEEGKRRNAGEREERTASATATAGETSPEPQVDKLQVYKCILELLQPGETVTKVKNS